MIGRKGNKKAWGLLLVMLALFCVWIPRERATASSAGTGSTSGNQLTIVEIDYEKETMTIQSTQGDTCLYYSDAKQKTWECAYGTFGNVEVVQDNGTKKTYPNAYVLDISWVKKTKDYVLTLKGDRSDAVVSVTLPKQQTSFKVTFDYTTGEFTYLNYPDSKPAVSWRKNNSTTWEPVDSAVIQRFYAKGVTLYFRFEQIPGKSAKDVGSRPSKEVKLSIVKQASEPSVTITTSTQVLTLPALLQYQVYEGTALKKDWTTASSKKLSIPNDIAVNAYYGESNPDTKEIKVVFRTAATAKKPASMEKTITIKAQEAAPTNVKIQVARDNALSLTIVEETQGEGEDKKVVTEGASSSNPYEYTIITPDSKDDLTTATWKTITSASSIMLAKEKVAPPDSVIYVRKKAHVASDDKSVYYPESKYYSYKVGDYSRATSTVELVDGKSTDYAYQEAGKKVINLVKEEGVAAPGLQFLIISDMTVSGTGESNSEGSNAGTEATKVKVDSILCNNIKLDFKCEDYPSSGAGDAAAQAEAKILVTIEPSSSFEAVALGSTAYPLTITLNNGEVLNDLVQLTILKKAYLKQECTLNIIEKATYTADANPYRFVLVSTRQLSKDSNGNYKMAEIESMKLDEKEIISCVAQNQNPAEGTIEVILGVANQTLWDSVLKDLKQDQKYSLEIIINDAEEDSKKTKISKGVEIIYTKEATIAAGTAWQRTKASGEDLEENLEIKMSYKTPGVSISGVTLVYGTSTIDITGNCYVDSQYVYAVLSKNKINAVDKETLGIVFDKPYKVQITFSNNAVVETGCTITFKQ